MSTPQSSVPWWNRIASPLSRVAAQLGWRSPSRRETGLAQPRRTKEERDRARIDGRAQRDEVKRRSDEAREARRRQLAGRREDARRAYERSIDAAYASYQRVRDWAARLRQADDGTSELVSDAERRMATALAPLWHADRATVATLRRWCDPLNGAPSPQAADIPDDVVDRLRRQVTILRKQERADFIVPDVATLGACSVMVSDELHSEDSIKFALAATALQDGAVFTAFRAASYRRVVWEIGGGWGGFARHFKALCPNVTYVITGRPERLLVSAVYLMAAFPDANCRLHLESAGEDTWSDWEQVDFVFAVDGTGDTLRPPRVDLTIDLGELMLMTPSRVSMHVERAYEWGSTYFYSLLPAPAVTGPASPWPVIERWYWPQPIPQRTERSTVYTRIIDSTRDVAHLVGWRRMRVSA